MEELALQRYLCTVCMNEDNDGEAQVRLCDLPAANVCAGMPAVWPLTQTAPPTGTLLLLIGEHKEVEPP